MALPKAYSKNHPYPKTEVEWVSYVNKCHGGGLQNRLKHEQQWVINLCYYLGFQRLWYANGKIRVDDQDPVLHVNRIASWIESRHAKLTKSRPVGRVIPDSNDPADKMGAKYGDWALMNLFRKIGMEQVYDDIIMQMLICGTTFGENLWDPYEGDVIKIPKMKDDDVSIKDGELEEERVFSGEVCSKSVSPFGLIIANDSIPKLQDQPWVIKRNFLSLEQVYETWPKLKDKIQIKDDQSERTEYEKIVHRLGSPSFHRSSPIRATMDANNNEVLVKSMWIKPNDCFEDGAMVTVIGDQYAMGGNFPDDYGKAVYPFVKFQENNSGFHFYTQATMERLIPIQRAYNELKQSKVQNARLMAKGKWMNPKGSQVLESSLTDEEGEVIEYNSSVPEPHQAAISPLPNYVENLESTLLNDFRDSGGQREAPFNPPPTITASVALQTLNELSEEVLIPISRRLARSMELMSNSQLNLIVQNYIEKRLIKIFNESNSIGAQFLSALDLKNQTDVHIETESLLPELRSTKKQALFELWDRRIIQDPAQFVNLLRYGNFDTLQEELERVDEQFQADLAMLKNGKDVAISPFQDNQKYAMELMKFTQTPEFERMIPERKQLIMANLQKRLILLQQSVAQAPPETAPNGANTGTEFGPQKPVGVA